MKQSSTEQCAKWRGLVSEQLSSGQTVAEFCRDRGIRDSQFYDWKKRVRESKAGKFVEVKLENSGEQRKPGPEHHPAIEIRLSRGRSLLVEHGFDASHLRALLAVPETEQRSVCRACMHWIILRVRRSGWQRRRRTCGVALIGSPSE